MPGVRWRLVRGWGAWVRTTAGGRLAFGFRPLGGKGVASRPNLGSLSPWERAGVSGLVRKRALRGPDGLGEVRQHRGVEAVRLGQSSAGLGEVAHLPRVDHGYRQLRRGQCGGRDPLESARGFQHDQLRRLRLEAFDQGRDAGFIIGKAHHLASFSEVSRRALDTSIPM